MDMDLAEGKEGSILSKKRGVEYVSDGDQTHVDNFPEKKLKLSVSNFSSDFVVSKVEGLGKSPSPRKAMKILCWNCHGIGNPWTVKALQDQCWRDKSNIVFVMESMIDDKRLNKVKNKCGYVDGVCISSIGKSGEMGMWWKNVKVNVVSFSMHHFAIDILDDNNCVVRRAIGIYGWPGQNNKNLTWSLMSSLKADCNFPCVMFGDFNEITSLSEKEGGAPRCERLMDSFREAMDTCALRDLGFKGSIFT